MSDLESVSTVSDEFYDIRRLFDDYFNDDLVDYKEENEILVEVYDDSRSKYSIKEEVVKLFENEDDVTLVEDDTKNEKLLKSISKKYEINKSIKKIIS